MASSTKTFFTLALFAAADLVAGHGAITGATGNAGGSGMALGIVTSTPRDGTNRNPFQQDSTRFRGASAKTLGETVGAGANQLEAGTQKILAETGGTLPQVTPGGSVQMTLHQVNADGAGPYTCMINADATAQTWTDIQVTQNVPGRNSRSAAGAKTDFPLAAAIPASQTCTGTVAGQSNVCLVRCQNAARAGPFGGVVPVQLAGAGAAAGGAGNGTAVAAPATTGGAAAGSKAGSAAGSKASSAAGAAADAAEEETKRKARRSVAGRVHLE